MKRNVRLLAISTFTKVSTSSIHCLTVSNKSLPSAEHHILMRMSRAEGNR